MARFELVDKAAPVAIRGAILAFAAVALTACDTAGSVLDDTARLAAVEQCRQVSESAGIAAGAVESVCNCAADKWLAKPVVERVQLDRATIQSIISECAGTGKSVPAQPRRPTDGRTGN